MCGEAFAVLGSFVGVVRICDKQGDLKIISLSAVGFEAPFVRFRCSASVPVYSSLLVEEHVDLVRSSGIDHVYAVGSYRSE